MRLRVRFSEKTDPEFFQAIAAAHFPSAEILALAQFGFKIRKSGISMLSLNSKLAVDHPPALPEAVVLKVAEPKVTPTAVQGDDLERFVAMNGGDLGDIFESPTSH